MFFRPRLFSFLIPLGLLICSCSSRPEVTFSETVTEQYRPEYHFTPQKGWMNDPNGMFYLDGEYHLFYQYYPDSTVWGPMHWGHAVSKDLVRWEELPIAIYPDSLGYIFSGSAVYDRENTSGLGTEETPPIVAVFTYHDMAGEKSGATDFQSQGIAFSVDKGRTWTKYEGNPVLPNQGIRDFRDPKVTELIKEDGTKRWNMTLAAQDRIQFFESEDLKTWKFTGEFGQSIGAHGGVWECPDLLSLTAPNGDQKWVLLVSINPGGPQKGSATQYFIGNFENGTFTPDDTMIRWLDYGPDNYAGVTWSNLPEEESRTLFIGWMSNWLYAQVVPTTSWRSAMTVARELSLIEINGVLLLKSAPAKELESLRGEEITIDKTSNLPSQAVEIKLELDGSDNFALVFSNELNEKVSITKEMGLVSIDRTYAGNEAFHPDFAAMHSAPMSWKAEDLRIFLDACSIEVFVNNGELVMTSTLFPSSPWKKAAFISGIENASFFDLKK
ncbi:glycoside hydrolase family 32 protein [Algoriphagus boritolerans]|uniref:Fructan beta-fructosidase n=1 Tax=Algoriphagus boritolerans DSM 17298 = JCM 18970 TaxID=1120964 RepID=A0A1H5TKP2_9BACT|nr:glycoside hydrolase family 32 protein [Algoriphagus boritolerans]SEF63350.1 fructan beta-fructosidase [Algoriphagus boritolerans DSM 17298 = JCM 18970]